MAKPGPAKGHGGRPRKKEGSKLTKGKNKGYIKVTVGPPGQGTQKYKHRVVTNAPKGYVVHHRDDTKSNDEVSNLLVTSRAVNTADRNRDHRKRSKRSKKTKSR